MELKQDLVLSQYSDFNSTSAVMLLICVPKLTLCSQGVHFTFIWKYDIEWIQISFIFNINAKAII